MMPLLFVPLIALAVVAALVLWSAWVKRGVERWVPADGAFIEVPGVRFHYVDLGPKGAPAIVMVHGIMSQLRVFSHSLAERLAADHRVILVDRPGWGYSTLTGKRLDIAAQADAITALIAALGIEKPLLVGHSMGGAVSLALALAHPGSIRAAALIAPLTQPIDTPPAPLKGLVVPFGLRTAVAWTIAVPIALRSGKAKTVQVFAPDPVPEDFPIKGGGALAIRPPSFVQGCFEMAAARPAMAAQAPHYGEVRVPVAILYGRGDALLDPALHGTTTAAAIPHASATLVEGGHMLPITHPDAVEAWLRSL